MFLGITDDWVQHNSFLFKSYIKLNLVIKRKFQIPDMVSQFFHGHCEIKSLISKFKSFFFEDTWKILSISMLVFCHWVTPELLIYPLFFPDMLCWSAVISKLMVPMWDLIQPKIMIFWARRCIEDGKSCTKFYKIIRHFHSCLRRTNLMTIYWVLLGKIYFS